MMRFLGRVVAAAIVRRVVGVLLAVALSYCAVGVVRAQATCSQSGTCNIQQAWAECQANASTVAGHTAIESAWCQQSTQNLTTGNVQCFAWRTAGASGVCTNYGAVANQFFYVAGCAAGHEWDPEAHTCNQPPECSAEDAALSGGFVIDGDKDGEVLTTCVNQCMYGRSASFGECGVIDDVMYCKTEGYIPLGANCTPGTGDGATPPGDADGDGVSDGNDSSPNNPGEGGNEPPEPPEGSNCGGVGEPPCGSEESEPNEAWGGGDCATPPRSKGDPIAGQIAYQTWATRCALEHMINGKPGGTIDTPGTPIIQPPGSPDPDPDGEGETAGSSADCDVQPTCSSADSIGCAMLRQQWINHCKVAGDLAATGIDPEADLDFADEAEGIIESPITTDDVDIDGFGAQGTCPVALTFTAFGRTYVVDEDERLCELLRALRALILLMASYHAGVILLGGRR